MGGKDCSIHFRKRSGSKEGSKDFRRIDEIVATKGASLKVDYAYRSLEAAGSSGSSKLAARFLLLKDP